MLDNAAMTSIATVVGAGGMIGMQGTAAFAPDIKAALNELDPNIARRIGESLTQQQNKLMQATNLLMKPIVFYMHQNNLIREQDQLFK